MFKCLTDFIPLGNMVAIILFSCLWRSQSTAVEARLKVENKVCVCVDSTSALSIAFTCLLLGRGITFICRKRRPRSFSRDKEKESMRSVWHRGWQINHPKVTIIYPVIFMPPMCSLSSAFIHYKVLDIGLLLKSMQIHTHRKQQNQT